MEHINCAICGENKTAVLARKGIFEKGGPIIDFINVVCLNCGLVFRNPRENSEERDKIYKKIYLEKRHSFANVAEATAFVKSIDQKNKGEQIALFLKDFLDTGANVLDIGSGLGLVSGYLKNRVGANVLGIEPSDLSAEVARKIYGMEIFSGTLDDFMREHNKEKKFDCIILHHVFEHFGDPLAKLGELKSLLSSEGILYIEVPNVLDFKKPISQFFDLLHLYNYCPETLIKMLQKGGFKIIKFNKEKRYRIQILAALNSYSEPSFSAKANGQVLAKQIINYCKIKRAEEIFNYLLLPARRLKQVFFKI